MKQTLEKVTTVICRDRRFIIAKDSDNLFWSIEDNLINDDGTFKRTINGLEGLINKNINWTINATIGRVEIDYMVSQGTDPVQAAIKYYTENPGLAKSYEG